ncbi:MAG: glycoside hydrolase family 43 protein [Candidatus Fimimonas sp.]
MKLNEIVIRDPFVLADEPSGKYYMYASSPAPLQKGFCAYVSEDLQNWQPPQSVFVASEDFWAKDDFWAPEVHVRNGKYFMFATFGSGNKTRTSQILVANNPLGPFQIHSDALAPKDWLALDATLYVENEVPYAVFSHEWLQTDDGEMCYVRLTDDLSATVGKPELMFCSSSSGWAKSPSWNPRSCPVYVVDAPFVCNVEGVQCLLWSSWSQAEENSYSVGVVYPTQGSILKGNYKHQLLKLPKNDSGHAMVFKDFCGRNRICYHENNSDHGNERAAIYYVGVKEGELYVYEK